MYKIRDWLYIGKYVDSRDLALLHHHRINAILQLADAVEHPEIEVLYLPVEDGEPLAVNSIKQGVDFINAHKSDGHSILVACGAGISRSVSFAVAALKEAENLTLWAALQAIRQHHPDAMPHPALWLSLSQYYGEDENQSIEALWLRLNRLD